MADDLPRGMRDDRDSRGSVIAAVAFESVVVVTGDAIVERVVIAVSEARVVCV